MGRRGWIIAGAVVVGLVLVVALGLVNAMLAIVLGIGGAAAYFWGANWLADKLPERRATALRPWIFIAPAIAFLTLTLVFPAVWTLWMSALDAQGNGTPTFENWSVFNDSDFLIILRNNIFWLVGVTALSTIIGLAVAALADNQRFESSIKALIFLPMAISFVGAAVIWRFVYAFKPEGTDQTGLLNAVTTSVFGSSPQAWLTIEPWNNFLLIWVMIWMWTGFALVVLSAAIKAVPDELIEAARIDGAGEFQAFWHITLPAIRPTIVVVVTTTIILVLKVFDIVRVMTSGQFDTNVLANGMIDQLRFGNRGVASVYAVVLFLAVSPVLIYNIRQFRREVSR